MVAGADRRRGGWGPALVDLSRARQALLSIAQPALGALIAYGALPPVRVVAIGVLAAATGFLAVFSLNDVLDLKADVRALESNEAAAGGFDIDTVAVRHPLARGDLSLGASIAWVGTLGLVSAVSAWVLSPVCLALFGAAVALEALYCMLRSVTWLKTVVSGVMVGIGGLAGWAAVAPLTVRAASFFGFLALWEIAGRNLPNDLADIEADRPTGIRTVATVFGPRTSARAIAAGTLATLLAMVALPVSALSAAAGAAVALWLMVLPAARLLGDPTPRRAASYFNRASLVPAFVFVLVLGTSILRW